MRSSSGLTERSSTPRPLDSMIGASGILDRPPEPVIGRRVAPTRWRVMAAEGVPRASAVIASAAKQPMQRTRMDCFVASAPLRERFAFVAGNDVLPHSRHASE
jgi:hypothetical protein